MNNSLSWSGLALPRSVPVTGLDRVNYLYKYGHSNIQIQAVIAFDQHLDKDILKKAVRSSLDAEPILRSRFIEDDKQAHIYLMQLCF